MAKVVLRKDNKERRKLRVKKKVFGTLEMPRLSVYRSNRYIYVQLVDDVHHKTLLSTSAETKQLHEKRSKSEAGFAVGELIAQKALKEGIKKVVFDRAGYRYHGRVKQVAEGARKGGLIL